MKMKTHQHHKIQNDSSILSPSIQLHSRHKNSNQDIHNQSQDQYKQVKSQSYNRKNQCNQEQKYVETNNLYNLSYQLHHVSNEAYTSPAYHLINYSKKSYWKSYGHHIETIVLKFQYKVLVSKLCILNKVCLPQCIYV